jgi:co-chaperonin GroES (HSP10)
MTGVSTPASTPGNGTAPQLSGAGSASGAGSNGSNVLGTTPLSGATAYTPGGRKSRWVGLGPPWLAARPKTPFSTPMASTSALFSAPRTSKGANPNGDPTSEFREDHPREGESVYFPGKGAQENQHGEAESSLRAVGEGLQEEWERVAPAAIVGEHVVGKRVSAEGNEYPCPEVSETASGGGLVQRLVATVEYGRVVSGGAAVLPTGGTVPVPTGHTAEVASRDTAPVSAGDTVPVPTGDTAEVAARDTASVSAGDTVLVPTGNTAKVAADDTVPVPTGHTAEVASRDTAPVSAGDTVPVPTGDTAEVAARDTASVSAGDTVPVPTGNTAKVAADDTVLVPTGNISEVVADDTVPVLSGDTAKLAAGDTVPVPTGDVPAVGEDGSAAPEAPDPTCGAAVPTPSRSASRTLSDMSAVESVQTSSPPRTTSTGSTQQDRTHAANNNNDLAAAAAEKASPTVLGTAEDEGSVATVAAAAKAEDTPSITPSDNDAPSITLLRSAVPTITPLCSVVPLEAVASCSQVREQPTPNIRSS